MRKIAFFLAFMLIGLGLQAQDYRMNLHHAGQVMFQNNVNEVNNMNFQGSNPSSLVIDLANGNYSFPITAFDSITFVRQNPPQIGDTIMITYNGDIATVVNPYPANEVFVTVNGAKVTITSISATNIIYCLSGTANPGRFEVESNTVPTVVLNGVHLTNPTGKAMDLTCEAGIILNIADGTENTLCDGAESDKKAALMSNNDLLVQGNGALTVTGLVQHAMKVKGQLNMTSGNIVIANSVLDGIHSEGLLVQGGSIDVQSCGDDGLTSELDGYIYGGHITITSDSENINAISADSTLVISGGIIDINITGVDSKCIKADKELTINGGTFILNHSGNVSKGIKSNSLITITDGDITIVSSGSTVVENIDGQNVPSYCTAIKSDTDINISGGTINITLPTTNQGGKSISADGDMTISGGDFTITTNGAGAAYTVSGSTKDSYTSSCLKSDGNMEILAGTFTLTSTGAGGKGINAGGTMKIGLTDANSDDLILNVTTSGERITVTSGGGGGWPPGPGQGGDYANPKAIKAAGNLTINSGTLRVNCLQTQNEGGECIESKAVLTINGGDIEAYSKKDDAVNAANQLIINGGIYYVHSDANDGTDSNGTMQLNGGLCISNGSRSPEEGFDCDWNQFKVTGGTHIGTGGGTSDPTANVCTQPSLKINTQQGYAIQILKSDGTIVCTYKCPNFTSGGGGPGGGNSMVMLFTDPQLQTGQTYTVKYGGTISGGTNWNGYYTGNVTYSGGQSTTVTISSMYSTVSAGGR